MSGGIGVVAIGRNEGERLKRCLRSVIDRADAVVYVDSGSHDGSVSFAHALGAWVVELDASVPFTAARARNAGLACLWREAPGLELVQFVDGDCEVVPGWLDQAEAEMNRAPAIAVVCGRRRELSPEASVYNRLCDMEWDTPVGYVDACGGDALMRMTALAEVAGYDPTVIAGEEPELCFRLRERGWRISRIDAEMTRHDAAMTEFGQWWRRSLRAGHAYAEGAARHADSPRRYWQHEVRSNWFWGLAVPAAALGLAAPTLGLSLALFGGHALLGARIERALRAKGFSVEDARLYARACVLGKLPQALGQLRYWQAQVFGSPARIIEYKSTVSPA